SVFTDAEGVMANIERVDAHLAARVPEGRRMPRLLRTRAGRSFWTDADGGLWRGYTYVPGSETKDVVARPWDAYQAARAFGTFQYLVSDLPGGPLAETLPGFHDTPRRLAALEAAAKADAAGRLAGSRAELAWALEHRVWAGLLEAAAARGDVSAHVAHNDTKINNVLFDSRTNEALCVIDFDTVMPGLMLYDFGDFTRTSVSPAPEDETDLEKVVVRLDVFEALVQGWREGSGGTVSEGERALLPDCGRVISYELGLRFLADHLAGDRYFKVHRPGHNLERARCQFRLAEELGRRRGELARYC
ncbi:aminoglycoside phosphotransferase family protein, partial [bacterium]